MSNKEAADSAVRLIESSPQIHHRQSTASIMWTVSATLLPAAVWGVYLFGKGSLTVLIASVLSAVLFEPLLAAFTKRVFLSGGRWGFKRRLIGFNMPPEIPLYIPILGSIFAIAVVKWTFGGLGGNWMNPALAGRVFVFFSWTGEMTRWKAPKSVAVDALSGSTPLSNLKTGLIDYSGTADGPVPFFIDGGYQKSGNILSEFFTPLFGGGNSGAFYADLFTGNIAGCIGEVSALLLILGALYLFVRKIITWQIPLSYLATFGVLVWIFGGMRYGEPAFSGDLLFHFFTGGLMLGALYMATDMVTSPVSGKGMIIYGVGIGFLTFLIRFFGSFPEGVSLAIILMNIFVPMIDRYIQPVRFGLPTERTLDVLKKRLSGGEKE